MIDRFSRYCMLVPVTNIKALTITMALQEWTKMFGPPQHIISDNGSQFISALFKHWNTKQGTDLKYTSTYHPECNGMIERFSINSI